MEIKQSVFARARRGDARPRDPRLQHLLALDHRDGRGDAAARQGRRLPLLLSGLGDAAGRDHRAARTPRARRCSTAFNFAQAIRKQPITCEEVPGFVVNRILNSAVGEVWRAAGGEVGSRSRRSTRASRRRTSSPMGPFFLDRHARARHRLARRRAPERVLRRQLLRPQGDAEAGRGRQARRKDRRRRLLQGRRAADRGRRAIPTPRSSPTCSCSRRWSRRACCSRRASAPSARSTSG